ncbi:hypothetical protein A2U01_0071163, partial [Trifolium medium]|nr:hypothetical protein [Trifolium medium]
FWNLRAAQEYWRVAPVIWQAVDVFSGKCASCRVLWRVASFVQEQQGFSLVLARRAGLIWRGAQERNFKSACITVTCALRIAYGAARRINF